MSVYDVYDVCVNLVYVYTYTRMLSNISYYILLHYTPLYSLLRLFEVLLVPASSDYGLTADRLEAYGNCIAVLIALDEQRLVYNICVIIYMLCVTCRAHS